MTRTTRLIVLVVLAAVASATVAGAQSLSTPELAEEALNDQSALDELNGSSPLAADALDGGDAEVQQRLETLAAHDPPDEKTVDAIAVAPSAVDEILAQDRYDTSGPNPLEAWWQEMVLRLGLWFNRLFGAIVGGPRGLLTLLALAVIALVAFFTIRLARGRVQEADRAAIARGREEQGLDPDELLRLADEASSAGDHQLAVRLLYLAGLLRMSESGLVDFTAGTTSSEVADQLESETFDRLWSEFDAVAYGNAPAGPTDVERAQKKWSDVLEGDRP